jgi:arginase
MKWNNSSNNTPILTGMPVAFLMNLVENANKYPSMKWFTPCLKPRDLVYIGLRDLDEAEKAVIKRLSIKAYTVSNQMINALDI